ncbi:MAG: cytochrome C [Chloroflexi bacterium]|nr:cytochrome C [Chloroflexota bacterium]MBT5627313.1 cytochrome C [Chloroflexota bacterium]
MKEKAFGPRIPREIVFRDRFRFILPTLLMLTAAVVLFVSTFFPYWHMDMEAPQYPRGLEMTVFVNHVEGDVQEVDTLNHYIGMRPLSEAGELERSLAVIAIGALVMLVVAAIFIHNPCALLLTWPVILYPGIFLLDLWYWMQNFGMNLDDSAPLSSIIEPFVPPLIGEGKIAQFTTYASWESGLWMSAGASVLIILGIFFHRRAYKPLLDEAKANRQQHENQ